MAPQIVYLAYALLWFRGLVPRNALASAEPPRRIGGGSRRWPLAIPVDTLARQTRSWCYGDFHARSPAPSTAVCFPQCVRRLELPGHPYISIVYGRMADHLIPPTIEKERLDYLPSGRQQD